MSMLGALNRVGSRDVLPTRSVPVGTPSALALAGSAESTQEGTLKLPAEATE